MIIQTITDRNQNTRERHMAGKKMTGQKNTLRSGRLAEILITVIFISLMVVPAVNAQDNEKSERYNSQILAKINQELVLQEKATNRVRRFMGKKISIELHDTGLEEALEKIAVKSGLKLSLSDFILPTGQKISLKAEDMTVNEVLWEVLKGTNLRYAVSENGHLVFMRSDVKESAEVQGGIIRGTVTDAASGESLPGANVFLDGTQKGATTNVDGVYELSGIEAGTYTLIARFIGFQGFEQQVEIDPDDVLTIDIALGEELVGLDEVVVTGTVGESRRREVGNSISSVNMEEAADFSSSTEGALQAQAPGVSVMQTSGSMGGGAQIRIRGNVSVSMSNQPLIYIDGIRLRSEPYPENVPPVGFNGRGANITATPLNDINPSDISNIEIIKGAAATTLYGSEAAAGVIQIFTKMGSANGKPVWQARIDQGASWTPKFGTDDVPYIFLDPWLKTAHTQSYSLSVRGGEDQTQYFVSGSYADNDGVLPNDTENKFSARANVRTFLTDKLILRINNGYTRHDIWNTPSGNNAQGLTLNAYRRDRNYIGSDKKEDIDQFLAYEINTLNNRFISGASLLYEQLPNLSHEARVGFDFANSELWQFRPVGFPGADNGIRSNIRWTYTSLTLNYQGSFDWLISPDLRTKISWGGETITTQENNVTGYGDGFPGPGDHTLTAAANRLTFEDRIKIITGGVYSQVLLDYKDRYFLTLGFRLDGNSAFGENLGLQPYPKASLSYVLSEESFWDQNWGDLRLRVAYGHAGRAPGAFDAVRTWLPVGWGNQVAFSPENVGNPDLGPERTIETEFGFDASFLNQRFDLEFTFYNQHTRDALLAVNQVPSQGFLNSQLRNIGELQNRGVEVAVSGVPILTPGFGLTIGADLSYNKSEVLDLGDAPSFMIGNYAGIFEGHPAPVVRADRIINPDEIADPEVEEDYFYGPDQPTHIVGLKVGIDLPWNITVSARGEYQGGHYIYDGASLNSLARGVAFPTILDALEQIEAGNANQLTARERAWAYPANVRGDWFIYPADFFKLRSLSIKVPLPATLFKGADATLVFSGHNLYTWKNKDFPIFDPEITWTGATDAVREIGEHIPPTAGFTGSLQVTF